MNQLKVFNHEVFGSLEVLLLDEKEYFPATDVASQLGYAKPHNAINRHCKESGSLFRGVTDSLGRVQQKKFINEGNLYRLIARSELPEAEKFESWVFDEVLPSVRKHGAYATPQMLDNMIDNPEFRVKVFTALQKEREEKNALQIEAAEKDKLIGELKPKAAYTDIILKSKGLVTVTQIAKDYGMTAPEMNNLLHGLEVQYKQSKQWLLYKKYADQGYVHSQTIPITRSDGTLDVSMNTKWTQKGRLFIYELLKLNDVLPVIERDFEILKERL